MTPTEHEAIQDCKYALNLGEEALKQHWLHWRGATLVVGSDDAAYAKVVMQVYDNLGTPECLLKEVV